MNRRLNQQYSGCNVILSQTKFTRTANKLVITRTTRNETKKGKSLNGQFTLGPFPIALGSEITTLDVTGLNLADSIMLGKCFVLSECSYLSVEDDESFNGTGNSMDFFMSNMNSGKYIPTHYSRSRPRPVASADQFFKPFSADLAVKAEIRNFIPSKYLRFYDGAYINTDLSMGAMFKLYEKMRGVADDSGNIITTMNMSDEDYRTVFTIFLQNVGIADHNIPIRITPESLMRNHFRGAAGTGADPYLQEVKGTKGSNLDVHFDRIKWISRMLSRGKRPEEFLPPWLHVICPKAEVRSPDVDPEKIRLVWMQNMEVGTLTKQISAPMQKQLEGTLWYMPGKGLMGKMLPWILLAFAHPDFSKFRPDWKAPPRDIAYAGFDLSTQDLSYIGKVMMTCMVTGALLLKPPDKSVEVLLPLIAYIWAWTICKLAQLWGGKAYYTVVFASGSDLTTIMDTIMDYFVFHVGIYKLCESKSMDPLEVFPLLKIICYGDDTGVSGPVWLMEILFPQGDFTAFSTIVKDTCGAVFKPSQCFLYVPVPDHRDRFYTWIDEDNQVISPGFKMLQRQWIKYDKNLKPLHPDSKEWHCVLPWRHTSDLVPKLGLDVKNWKDSKRPWVAWYQKAFGLLIDSVANAESHNMIKAAMEYVQELYPSQVEDAESSFNWQLHANTHKLGTEFDNSLIKCIPRSEHSMKVIASLFLTRAHHVNYLFPQHTNMTYDDLAFHTV